MKPARTTGLWATMIATTLGLGLWTPSAHADLGACNATFVEARAECTVIPPSAQCQTMCTPVSVRAACAARLSAQCAGECSKLPSVECTGACSATCNADCSKLSAGKLDCDAECRSDCSGRCTTECASQSGATDCQSACEGSCAASCQASCDAKPPQADCSASCEACCQGSCKVDTNLDCQLACQAKGELKCTADVTGGCKTKCQQSSGALFCSGQFVDYGDELQQCIDALKAKYDVVVMASASGSSSCDDAGTCMASGSARVSGNSLCSSVGGPGAGQPHPSLAVLGLGLLLAAERWRRTRAKRGMQSRRRAQRPT